MITAPSLSISQTSCSLGLCQTSWLAQINRKHSKGSSTRARPGMDNTQAMLVAGQGSHGKALTVQSPRSASCSCGSGQLTNHKEGCKEAVVLLGYAGAHHIAVVVKPFLHTHACSLRWSMFAKYRPQLCTLHALPYKDNFFPFAKSQCTSELQNHPIFVRFPPSPNPPLI